jgi:hypothetical protein
VKYSSRPTPGQLLAAKCGRFNSHNKATTNNTANPPKKMVKNWICLWWADGFLFRLTADNLLQTKVTGKQFQLSNRASSGATTKAGR